MSTGRDGVRTAVTLMMLVFASTSWATAGVTSIVLNSEPGDYIGGGQTLMFVDTDGPFVAQRLGNGNAVRVWFNTPTYNHFWYLDFAAPDLLPLVVGPYEGAVRYPFQGTGQPGLSVSGDGRGCSTLTGRFDVLELVLGGADEVLSFRATFEQHCEGFVPALRGEVRYNATVPLQLTTPAAVTTRVNEPLGFTVSALVTQGGGQVILSASGLQLGASFVDHHNNTGTFSWTPLGSQAGTHLVRIQGTTGALVETAFVRITVMPTPPPNDEIENAILITGLPFTHTQNTATATVAPDDPFCFGSTASVWFTYTPMVGGRVEFNTVGSNYATTLSAYAGTRGNLSQLACNYSGLESRIRFDAVPGVTYYIMAGAPSWSAPGSLILNVLPAPPPFTMQLTLDTFSVVDASSGAVIVKGTATCSAPSFVHVNGSIRQPHGNGEQLGHFGVFVPCDGVTPWEAPVSYLTGGTFSGRASALFVAGRANVTASAQAYEPVEGTYIFRNAAALVRLRGGR